MFNTNRAVKILHSIVQLIRPLFSSTRVYAAHLQPRTYIVHKTAGLFVNMQTLAYCNPYLNGNITNKPVMGVLC